MPLDQTLLEHLGNQSSPDLASLDFPTFRAEMDALAAEYHGSMGPIEMGSVQNLEIEGNGFKIPLRVFRPHGEAKGTVHLFHGGGWSFGSIDFIEPLARRLASDLSMIVVASGYRLAPEHPFPAAFDDCLAAARWTLAHAHELGGENRPTVLAGESAGANLAAAVALDFAKQGARNFDAQLLLFPALDLREEAAKNPSRRANCDPTLRAEMLGPLFASYCDGHDPADPRISPIAAKQLAGLPPSLVVVLEVDPLHDEAVEYAERLKSADIEIELIEFDNLNHGFANLAALVPAAKSALETVERQLEQMLSRTFAGATS